MAFYFHSEMANSWKVSYTLTGNTKTLSLEAANAGNGVDGFVTSATDGLHNKGNK